MNFLEASQHMAKSVLLGSHDVDVKLSCIAKILLPPSRNDAHHVKFRSMGKNLETNIICRARA